jgi:hypothetical protein
MKIGKWQRFITLIHFIHIPRFLLRHTFDVDVLGTRPSFTLLFTYLCIPLQPLLNIPHLLRIPNLNNPIHLGRIPNQLLRARIQHLDFGITRNREIVQHDVGDGEAARVLGLLALRLKGTCGEVDVRVSTDNSTTQT